MDLGIFTNRAAEEQYRDIFLNLPRRGDDLADRYSLYHNADGPKYFQNIYKNLTNIFGYADMKNFYKINSMGFRSEEFKTSHIGRHILFAGCSNTFGAGTRLEDLWAYRLYKEISKDVVCSGYFNVGANGLTISHTISQVYNYCKTYGFPDIIFINFPDFKREFSYMINPYEPVKKNVGPAVFDVAKVSRNILMQYDALISLCELNNTKIHSMTWELHSNLNQQSKDPRYNFNDLITIDENELSEHCLRFTQNNPGHPLKDYFLVALDEDHQGIAIQDFWYNKMYQKYTEG